MARMLFPKYYTVTCNPNNPKEKPMALPEFPHLREKYQLTPNESRFLMTYHALRRAYGRKLTYRIIAREMGFKSHNSVTQYMNALRKKGYFKNQEN